jgi:hypothetical protein
MKRLVMFCAVLAMAHSGLAADKGGKWIKMFNGKDLDGWKANEKAENWKVQDGAIIVSGERSHLFWMLEECTNCEFKATIWLGKGSNSGMFFRARFMEGWPEGYEAQVNNSHTDPVRTASLYHFVKVFDQLVPDETWWTQHIIANGNHIVIKVNDKVVVDTIEKTNRFTKGYLAIQAHDPKSTAKYKDLMFRALPSSK